MQPPRRLPPLVFGLLLLGASSCQTSGEQQPAQPQPATGSAVMRSAASETETTPGESPRPQALQDRANIEKAFDLWVEGLIAGDADRIPLDSAVIYVRPDGSTESTLDGISTIAPFIERQSIDDIQVRRVVAKGLQRPVEGFRTLSHEEVASTLNGLYHDLRTSN